MNLNAAEKKWIAELQAVLDACPSKRLGFYTIGDPNIYIYDLRKEKQINDEQDRGGDFLPSGSCSRGRYRRLAGISFQRPFNGRVMTMTNIKAPSPQTRAKTSIPSPAKEGA